MNPRAHCPREIATETDRPSRRAGSTEVTPSYSVRGMAALDRLLHRATYFPFLTMTTDCTPPTKAKPSPMSTPPNPKNRPPDDGNPSGEEAQLPPLRPSIVHYPCSANPKTIPKICLRVQPTGSLHGVERPHASRGGLRERPRAQSSGSVLAGDVSGRNPGGHALPRSIGGGTRMFACARIGRRMRTNWIVTSTPIIPPLNNPRNSPDHVRPPPYPRPHFQPG